MRVGSCGLGWLAGRQSRYGTAHLCVPDVGTYSIGADSARTSGSSAAGIAAYPSSSRRLHRDQANAPPKQVRPRKDELNTTRRRKTLSNKEMQLTRPVQIAASQLISSVLRLLEGGTRLQVGVVAFGKVRLWLW